MKQEENKSKINRIIGAILIILIVLLLGKVITQMKAIENLNNRLAKQTEVEVDDLPQDSTDTDAIADEAVLPNLYDLDIRPLGKDYSDLYGDEAAVRAELYEACKKMPETLAATVSAFSKILKRIPAFQPNFSQLEKLPWYLDEILSYGENGGELQQALLAELSDVLNDPSTKIEFFEASGWQGVLYFYNIADDPHPTPATIGIVDTSVYHDAAPQVKITVTYEDGSSDTGLFDLRTGFTRSVWFEPID